MVLDLVGSTFSDWPERDGIGTSLLDCIKWDPTEAHVVSDRFKPGRWGKGTHSVAFREEGQDRAEAPQGGGDMPWMYELDAIKYVNGASFGMREGVLTLTPRSHLKVFAEDLSHCGHEALGLPACGQVQTSPSVLLYFSFKCPRSENVCGMTDQMPK